MTSPTRTQRRYDHRLRDLVRNTKSIDVAVRHGVPSSTARGWLAPRATPVVTLQATNDDAIRSQREVLEIGPEEMSGVLAAFASAWETWAAAAQARHLRLVVKRVDYDASQGQVSLTFNPPGIKTLAGELAGADQEKPCSSL